MNGTPCRARRNALPGHFPGVGCITGMRHCLFSLLLVSALSACDSAPIEESGALDNAPFLAMERFEDDEASQWALDDFFPEADRFSVAGIGEAATVTLVGPEKRILEVRPSKDGGGTATVRIHQGSLTDEWKFTIRIRDGCERPVDWGNSVLPLEEGATWRFVYNRDFKPWYTPSRKFITHHDGESEWSFRSVVCVDGVYQASVEERVTATVSWTASTDYGFEAPAPRDTSWTEIIGLRLTRTNLEAGLYLNQVSPLSWTMFGTGNEEIADSKLLFAGFGSQHRLNYRLQAGTGLTLLLDDHTWREGFETIGLERF